MSDITGHIILYGNEKIISLRELADIIKMPYQPLNDLFDNWCKSKLIEGTDYFYLTKKDIEDLGFKAGAGLYPRIYLNNKCIDLFLNRNYHQVKYKNNWEELKRVRSIMDAIPVEQELVQDIINTIPSKSLINYTDIALEIGKLVQEKNKQYGNAINDTADFLELLYPNGITLEDYKNIGAIVRVLDKLKRIANGNQGEENAWQDIAGYGILMCGSEE